MLRELVAPAVAAVLIHDVERSIGDMDAGVTVERLAQRCQCILGQHVVGVEMDDVFAARTSESEIARARQFEIVRSRQIDELIMFVLVRHRERSRVIGARIVHN